MKQPLGVILAGGQASRMGGGDKALLDLGGRPLLAHAIDRLEPQVAGLALNANGDLARFARFGLPVLPDPMPGHPGPLAGILAGLDWAADQGAETIVTVAVDTPFFPGDLVPQLLLGAETGGHGLALAESEGGLQPTFGLWPVALRDDLRQALAAGTRKLRVWALDHGAARVRFPGPRFDPFFNLNTPEDLARARDLLRG
ncbi:molybdenum cofactor guanylyltransferase MobA [Pseudodonghicola flavimaris]|uniref:Molybdenum cofactor guanylyltransferase n=1 Tax=Pseudodonghicola flavimaris TaxID=3050036 RepID=A0ABT7EY17_9RHOB|nr:molybdenum cofactor guanylyltransferase MobA [Pseudodonghicola flavimaris]MDK3017228.1 molybdenum cofactor guanylyltransferase MobA [Pseudodonghicola flavimaris]